LGGVDRVRYMVLLILYVEHLERCGTSSYEENIASSTLRSKIEKLVYSRDSCR
jgi:hypothetical protein